jgi:hypothetical protein
MKLKKSMLTNGFLMCRFSTYPIVFFLCFVCISCSSKKTEKKKAETSPSSIASERQMQVSFEEEIKRLKKENDELKRAVAKLLTFREEVKQLKKENDELKKAVDKAIQEKEQSGKIGRQPDKDKVGAIIVELDSAISAERKIELIKSLSKATSVEEPRIISVVRKALDDPIREVGRAAITLLEDYESPEIIPVIERALNSKDEQTRIDALSPLGHINDPQVGKLLIQALDDTSEDVRSAALEAADEQEDPINLSVMEKGIRSPYKDVKDTVVSMLESRGGHPAVEILIEGLKDTDVSFFEEINDTLDLLIDKQFKTYEEARSWWNKNKDRYDAELFEIEEDKETK